MSRVFPNLAAAKKPDRPVIARGDRRQSFRVARFHIVDGEASRGKRCARDIEGGLDRDAL